MYRGWVVSPVVNVIVGPAVTVVIIILSTVMSGVSVMRVVLV